jgi:Malectin domain
LDLVNGLVVNPAALGVTPQFNIRAVTGSLVQSVQFFPSERKENTQPFAYCGDTGGVYSVCADLKAGGPYTITARAYTQKNQAGTPLPDVSVTFSIAGPSTPVRAPTKMPVLAPTKAPVVPTRAPTKAPVSKAPVAPPVPAAPTPPFQTILINCGGAGYTDTLGRQWSSDVYFIGGQTMYNASFDILGTDDDTVYFSDRFGTFTYDIPVSSIATYSVVLHFAELA